MKVRILIPIIFLLLPVRLVGITQSAFVDANSGHTWDAGQAKSLAGFNEYIFFLDATNAAME